MTGLKTLYKCRKYRALGYGRRVTKDVQVHKGLSCGREVILWDGMQGRK